MPNKPRIQCPRLVHVAGPLDNRPAVGKHRELETFDHELEQEAVVTDLTLCLQMPGQLFEIELARRAVRDLNCIAATQTRRLRAVLAFEPFKPAALATGA